MKSSSILHHILGKRKTILVKVSSSLTNNIFKVSIEYNKPITILYRVIIKDGQKARVFKKRLKVCTLVLKHLIVLL